MSLKTTGASYPLSPLSTCQPAAPTANHRRQGYSGASAKAALAMLMHRVAATPDMTGVSN